MLLGPPASRLTRAEALRVSATLALYDIHSDVVAETVDKVPVYRVEVPLGQIAQAGCIIEALEEIARPDDGTADWGTERCGQL